MSLPPVVAELRANISEYTARMREARAEWSTTTGAIGNGTELQQAQVHLTDVSRHVDDAVRSTEVLRETSRESFGQMRTGLSAVLPGFGELTGSVGQVRNHMREVAATSREALEGARSHAEALKVNIDRLTLALDATERKMLEVDPASRGFTVANEKALALREQISKLNADLVATNAEMKGVASGKVGKVALAGAAGGVAIGGAVAGVVGYESVKAALAEQQAMALLENAVGKTKVSFEEFREPLENVLGQMRQLGHNDTDTIASVQALTTALHDPEKALNLTGLAANIAAARHLDLATATQYVAKVATGHVGTMGRLGLATKDAAGHTYTASQAIDALGRAYGGASAAYSHTLKGQLSEFRAQTEHVLAGIGDRLVPVLEHFGETMRHVGGWVREHVIPPLREFSSWVGDKLLPPVRRAADLIGGQWLKALQSITSAFHGNQSSGHKVLEFLKGFAEFIANKVVPALAFLIGWTLRLAGALDGILIQSLGFVIGKMHALQVMAGDTAKFLLTYFVRPVVAGFIGLAQQVTGLADKAFGWIPGLGGKLHKAKEAVDAFAADTDKTLAGWAADAGSWGNAAGSNFVGAFTAAVTHRDYKNVSVDVALGYKVTAPKDVNISSDYGAGVADVVEKAKKHVAKHVAAHHAKKASGSDAAKKAAAAHKAALAALKARMKAEADLVLAEAARVAAAREAQLKKSLAAALEVARQLDVLNKLNGSAAGRVDIVDGAVLNRGTSFAQLAGAGGGVTVNVHVAGTVTSERRLVDAVHSSLLTYGRQNINAGLA